MRAHPATANADDRSPSRPATEAILLVGGKGTRLRPLTVHTPKPMVPAAGVPFLTHQLARAKAAGVEHVVMATSYLAEVFEPYFGDGSALGLQLEYVTETEPLGTGGALRNVAHLLSSAPGEPVLVFNGDILTGLDIRRPGRRPPRQRRRRLAAPDPGRGPARLRPGAHRPRRPRHRVPGEAADAGGDRHRPDQRRCVRLHARRCSTRSRAGRPVSVERETFPGLLAAGAHLQGMVDSTYWLDLGTPQAFVRGSADLVLGRAPSPAVPGRRGDRLVLPGAAVAADAKLSGGTSVAAGAVIGPGARVEGSTVLAGARIDADAVVTDSLIGAGARIGAARCSTAP